jgi:predicted nucleotidyltransferase
VSDLTDDLPSEVAAALEDFVAAAKRASGENLKSVVLFGSAAEGRLRPTSDVNLILVFGEVRLAELDGMRDSFGFAHSAIALDALFLEGSEVPLAAQAFAVKFSDIRARHRVLYGADVFAGLEVSRDALIQRLKQVIINLTLRLRERYALAGAREEQKVRMIAQSSGPVRACAAAILELEGVAASSPKEALQVFVQRLPQRDWSTLVENLSAARNELAPAGEAASATISQLLNLLREMYRCARDLH